MKKRFVFCTAFYSLLFFVAANSFLLLKQNLWFMAAVIPAFLLVNLAGIFLMGAKGRTLRLCSHGTLLLHIFIITITLSVVFHIALPFLSVYEKASDFWLSVLVCAACHFVIFWNGMLCVYCSSVQLGLKHRLIGLLCGMIPVVNLFALNHILRITYGEVDFELTKQQVNQLRADQKLCATKYPILLVHGVFFRDSAKFNYWGRIPAELETNGAVIYYGNHQSAASIADSAAELAARIRQIVDSTHCEKVNIIAHSKGGLDCRYAIANLGIAPLVASLTTINTPHRGCLFADYLLTKIPQKVQNKVAKLYNATLKKLGDPNPDFLSAVGDLTDGVCRPLDKEMAVPEGIFCQSVGSVMRKANGGKFPLNYSYHLVAYFDGENDGLVSEKAFSWGEKYTCLRTDSIQGISHADMIDLSRENIYGFDVREFYVNLVKDLKERGL